MSFITLANSRNRVTDECNGSFRVTFTICTFSISEIISLVTEPTLIVLYKVAGRTRVTHSLVVQVLTSRTLLACPRVYKVVGINTVALSGSHIARCTLGVERVTRARHASSFGIVPSGNARVTELSRVVDLARAFS